MLTVVVCDFFPPAVKAGGPSRSIHAIVSAEETFSKVAVVTRDRDLGDTQPYSDRQLAEVAGQVTESVRVRRLPPRWLASSVLRQLRELSGEADLVYLNSVMSPYFAVWPMVLMWSRLAPRRTLLIAPRGELGQGALNIKATKKRLALPVIRFMLSGLDVVWHASSTREAADIQAFVQSDDVRVIVRANPAPPPMPVLPPHSPNRTLTLAFVARMVPIKNFALVVRALRDIEVPLRVVVAGSIEDPQYWEQCEELMSECGQNIQYDILGHVNDEVVSDILKAADAMVLPTRGENFGRAIAEALAVGCPVLIPDTTLWTPLLSEGAGWLIDTDRVEPLVEALHGYARYDVEQRSAKRRRTHMVYSRWWARSQSSKSSLFVDAVGCRKPQEKPRPINHAS